MGLDRLPDDLAGKSSTSWPAGGRLAVTLYPETSKPRRPYLEDEGLNADDSPRKKAKDRKAKAAKRKKQAKEGPPPLGPPQEMVGR